MKVQDVMTVEVQTCRPESNLAAVTRIMWESDCGMVPVVDADNRVTGVVTDRDICIALGTRNQPAASVPVSDVASKFVFTCSAEDELPVALAAMRGGKVRRLPVLDGSGRLCGVLSLDDVVLRVQEGPGDVKLKDAMVGTLKAICSRWKPPRQIAVPV
jgi:CBS domain-containing protein